MPDHLPPDDPDVLDVLDDGDDDLLARLRPPPPRTWRDRLDDLAADPPPAGRVVLTVVVIAVVALVAWRIVTPAPAPPEVELPLAQPAAEPADGQGSPTVDTQSGAASSGAPGGSGPGGEPAGPGSTTPATEVVVHVIGAVAAPGVQRLPTGSRVIDAVEAAGGAAPDADLARVNLAAVLVDGQQVVVLRPGEAPPEVVAAAPATPGSPDAGGAAGAGGPVDINRASPTELEELPGVGPATAEAIVSHRDENGPFASVDDLLDVRGIGEAKLEQLRDRATV